MQWFSFLEHLPKLKTNDNYASEYGEFFTVSRKICNENIHFISKFNVRFSALSYYQERQDRKPESGFELRTLTLLVYNSLFILHDLSSCISPIQCCYPLSCYRCFKVIVNSHCIHVYICFQIEHISFVLQVKQNFGLVTCQLHITPMPISVSKPQF